VAEPPLWESAPIVGRVDDPAGRKASGQEADTNRTTTLTPIEARGKTADANRTTALTPLEVREKTASAAGKERENELPNLTPGQKATDEAFGKDYAAWTAGGGEQGLRNKLKRIADLQAELRSAGSPGTLSGFFVGRAPTGVRQAVNERSMTLESDARSLVTATLRQILGAAFTEKEGERIFNQSFDPKLSEEANAHNLQRILGENLTNAAARVAATSYYEKNGTLQGFKQDMIADEFGKLTHDTEFSANGDKLSPEQEQAVKAYIASPDFTPQGYADLTKRLSVEAGRQPTAGFDAQALQLGEEIAARKARGETFGPGLRYVAPKEDAPPTPEAAPPLSGVDRALDVGVGAVKNFIPDLGGVVWDTAKGMWDLAGKSPMGASGYMFPATSINLGMGDAMSKLGLSALAKAGVGNASPQLAEAVGKMYSDRYGSTDAALNTLRDHPAEMLMDIATVFSGGEAAAPRIAAQVAKVPRLAGIAGDITKLGEASGAVARATDPLALAGKGVSGLSDLTAKYVPQSVKDSMTTLLAKYPLEMAGLPSGVGGENLRTAGSVGRESVLQGKTPRVEAFTDQRAGTAPIENIVEQMEAGVQRMRDSASERYQSDMEGVKADKTVLGFDGIDAELAALKNRAYFKDQVRDPAAARAYGDIQSVVEEWKSLPAEEFHTPEGMDALKQRIGGIEGQYQTENNRAAASIAAGVRKTVANEITQQAPSYATAMGNYSEAKDLLANIRSTLDSGKGRTDATIRRLQGILKRDDPGYAGKLLDEVASQPGNELQASLAGRAGEPIRPERYRAAVAGGMGLASLPLEALLGGNLANLGLDPKYLAAMTMMSPRVVTGGAYHAGQAAGLAELLARGGYDAYKAAPGVGRLGVNAVSSGEQVQDLLSKQNATPIPDLSMLQSRYPDAGGDPNAITVADRPVATDPLASPNLQALQDRYPAAPAPAGPSIPPGAIYDPATHSYVLPDGTRIPAPDMVSPVTGQ